jgi:hypothetical protein
MIDQTAGEYAYPRHPPKDKRSGIVDLARQGRDLVLRHRWLPAVIHRPPVIGHNALRYIDYFLGLLAGTSLDTRAKMEVIALVNGFALMYGGLEAALASQRARTGVTAQEQAAAPVATLVTAAASGQYPNLAAALAGVPSPPSGASDVFESSVMRLIDGALGTPA